jgi:steroid delta-isomerase-like uncharacterized protein
VERLSELALKHAAHELRQWASVSVERNRAVIRRFYDEFWNQWNLDVANEILAPDVRFRGSLGTTLAGVDAFKGYVEQVRTAFPDFQNQVDDLIAEDDKIVTRMTWTGTHSGELFGIAATGRRVTYVGAGIFHLLDAKIQEAWIVGDTQELWRTLGVIPESS